MFGHFLLMDLDAGAEPEFFRSADVQTHGGSVARTHDHTPKVDLRSSSKYVSLPSAPGTEQIRRVLRNVVHLLTRLLWPPMSF